MIAEHGRHHVKESSLNGAFIKPSQDIKKAPEDGKQVPKGRRHLRALQTKAVILNRRDLVHMGKGAESTGSMNLKQLISQMRAASCRPGTSFDDEPPRADRSHLSMTHNAPTIKAPSRVRTSEIPDDASLANARVCVSRQGADSGPVSLQPVTRQGGAAIWERRVSRVRAATNRFVSRENSINGKPNKTARETSMPLAPPNAPVSEENTGPSGRCSVL